MKPTITEQSGDKQGQQAKDEFKSFLFIALLVKWVQAI